MHHAPFAPHTITLPITFADTTGARDLWRAGARWCGPAWPGSAEDHSRTVTTIAGGGQ